jgi:hypothetical protein
MVAFGTHRRASVDLLLSALRPLTLRALKHSPERFPRTTLRMDYAIDFGEPTHPDPVRR